MYCQMPVFCCIVPLTYDPYCLSGDYAIGLYLSACRDRDIMEFDHYLAFAVKWPCFWRGSFSYCQNPCIVLLSLCALEAFMEPPFDWVRYVVSSTQGWVGGIGGTSSLNYLVL